MGFPPIFSWEKKPFRNEFFRWNFNSYDLPKNDYSKQSIIYFSNSNIQSDGIQFKDFEWPIPKSYVLFISIFIPKLDLEEKRILKLHIQVKLFFTMIRINFSAFYTKKKLNFFHRKFQSIWISMNWVQEKTKNLIQTLLVIIMQSISKMMKWSINLILPTSKTVYVISNSKVRTPYR